MLKITELRNACEVAEQAWEKAIGTTSERKLEKAMHAAHDAVQAELDLGKKLKAEYEAMGDAYGIGETNAGDTLDHATYGDARFVSSEYWKIAIDSFLLCQ